MVRRHLRLMAAVFLVVLAATAAFTMAARPTYTASVQLMVDKPGQKLLATDSDPAASSERALDNGTVETEVEVLRSPALAASVVRDLHLERDREFNPALARPTLLARARSLVGSLFSFSAAEPASLQKSEAQSPITQALAGHVAVRRVGTSYIIRLDVSSTDPEKSARIANAFARNYLGSQLAAKFKASQTGRDWLHAHMDELRENVLRAESALQNYKIQNKLLSADGATLTELEISSLDQQAVLSRAQQAEAEARLKTAMSQLASGSSGDDVGEALSSPVVQRLRQQRAEAGAKVASLESRYGPRHPDLLKAKQELAELDGQIQSEIERVVSNLRAQAAVAAERVASVDQSLNKSRAGLAATNRSQVRLDDLQRTADAERTLYEAFLSKYKELSAEAGLVQAQAHIVSLARAPDAPSAPNLQLNLLLGVAAGLACAAGSALVGEMFEKGFAEAEKMESELGLPYLGAIPSLHSMTALRDPLRVRPADHLIAKPISTFAESFRNLRAAIDFPRLTSKVRVLAVTSSLPGEGKSTTALALARSAALAGINTVVVDCDLRQRALDNMAGVAPRVGLVEVLNRSASLREALLVDEASGAMLLPVSTSLFTPKDLLNSKAMETLLGNLRRRFDLVILDTAPVILVAETRAVVRQADAVVLLVHWRRTPRVLVQTAVRLLVDAGVNLAGVALTRVDLRQKANIDPVDPTAFYRRHHKYYVA